MMTFMFMVTFMLFFFLSHPFFMSISLLGFSVCLVSFFFSKMFYWFSYMVILVYLGGVLVLFIYISSLVPNLQMKKSHLYFSSFLVSLCLSASFFFSPPLSYSNLSELKMNFSKFFSEQMFFLFFLVLIYLLAILVFISMFAKEKKAPLRSF